MPNEPIGLLISRDLIFTSKITGTAGALGRRMVVAGDRAQVLKAFEDHPPVAVLVDLGAGELVSEPTLRDLIEAAPPGVQFIAFGSHVDTAALDAARSAGCALVLPRSRFSAELPELIERFLRVDPAEENDAENALPS